VNTKKIRKLSGLTQEQIARALDITLNGWQRKEQHNTDIKVELKIAEEMMAELLQFAHQNKTSVSELVSEMIGKTGIQFFNKDNSSWKIRLFNFWIVVSTPSFIFIG